MSDVDADETPSDGLVNTPKIALIVGIFIPVFFFLLDDLLGLIEGGGLFSIYSALRGAASHSPVINVDSAGLRTLFILFFTLLVMIPSAMMRANLANRLVALAVIMPIIAGGFVIDVVYDQRIMGYLLSLHGYQRCKNGGFHVGAGKSKVWFDNYVLSQASCSVEAHRY